ncbi:efflux RND transporter periplasmic adaptor subunit [bacterium]|nr:efflux RND transporter periplasmic adaptor subunit [bacterium]
MQMKSDGSDPRVVPRKDAAITLREPVAAWKMILRWAIRLSLLFGVLYFGFSYYQRSKLPPEVSVFEVVPQPISRVLIATGRVRPDQTITVYAKQAGQILKLLREEGETVKADEILVEMDAAAAEAALEQILAGIEAQKSKVLQARRERDRQQTLSTARAVPPELLERAQLAVDEGEQELNRLKAAETEGRKKIADLTLRSPIEGTILQRFVDPGQVVDLRSPIFEIATRDGVLEVEAEVDEAFGNELAPGLKCVLAPAGSPERWKGGVSFVSPRVDPSSGGRAIRVKLDSAPKVSWPPGLSVDVNVVVEERESALVVPRSSILDPELNPHVRIVEGDIVVERKISIIDWPARDIIVTSGLNPGDRVLLKPNALPIGTVVRMNLLPTAK